MRILRGLRGYTLPCGCTAGTYETYDGAIIELIDARESLCEDPAHYEGARLADPRNHRQGDPNPRLPEL